MDFAAAEIATGQAPPARKGGGGRAPVDFTPLFEAARAAKGDWINVGGGSALNNYRTSILQGAPEGCEVGEFDVRVVEETAPDTSAEPPVIGEYRIFICLADEKRSAELVANNERRLTRAEEKATAAAKGDPLDGGGKKKAKPAKQEAAAPPAVYGPAEEDDDPLA